MILTYFAASRQFEWRHGNNCIGTKTQLTFIIEAKHSFGLHHYTLHILEWIRRNDKKSYSGYSYLIADITSCYNLKKGSCLSMPTLST